LTDPLSVAVGSVKFVAASVVALGKLAEASVLKHVTAPYVVPAEFVATACEQ
jgi:hypothetical protein